MSIVYILLILIVLLVVLYFLFGGKSSPADEEQNAKMFAKLLISEIMLYENHKFETGLNNNNLYDSLRDEIEEARRKYKKRVYKPEFERFFDDALVKVLASGDKGKLGSNFISSNK